MKTETKVSVAALTLALSGCTSQLVGHPASSASAAVGGVPPRTPVTKADAAPGPDPHYECHETPRPFPSGLSLTPGPFVQLQGRVDAYCDTALQVPASQTTELILVKVDGKRLTEIATSTVEYPPGVGAGNAWQYTVNAPACVNGTYELDYLITGITSDGRAFDYPVIGPEMAVTDCPAA